MQETPSVRESSIMLESLLGEGTFGKVYSGEHGGQDPSTSQTLLRLTLRRGL